MLSFPPHSQFFSPPFPQALPGHTKGFFSPFSFLSRGSNAGAEGSRACAAHPPPSPAAGNLLTGAGGFPGSLLFRTAPCHRFGCAKPCLGTLLSWRDTAPALGLAMKRLLKAAVPCPRPLWSLTPALPHQLQAFLQSIFAPVGG